jgi:arylsulfatase A-like enzyme
MTKPGSVCERTVDFMTIFPTLCDLCGIAKPGHVEGSSIKALLGDPKAKWDSPGITTYQFSNHAVRTEGWRYIHYANGDEELYNEQTDPNEWTNLAKDQHYADQKAELAKLLPTRNAKDIGGTGGGEEGEKSKKDAKKEKKAKLNK